MIPTLPHRVLLLTATSIAVALAALVITQTAGSSSTDIAQDVPSVLEPTPSPPGPPAPYVPEVELTPAPTVVWDPAKVDVLPDGPTPSPPPFVKELGCQLMDKGPKFDTSLAAPQNLSVAAITYMPHFGLAKIDLNFTPTHKDVGCYIYEVNYKGQLFWVRSIPSVPAFEVPGVYCFRAATGNATGRSGLSNEVCVSLKSTEIDACAARSAADDMLACTLSVGDHTIPSLS